jgi:hypothetical protein
MEHGQAALWISGFAILFMQNRLAGFKKFVCRNPSENFGGTNPTRTEWLSQGYGV